MTTTTPTAAEIIEQFKRDNIVTRRCPDWCDQDPGHPYDSLLTDGTERECRGHDLAINGIHVMNDPLRPGVAQSVYVDIASTEIKNADDSVETSPPTIVLISESTMLTATQARWVADQLTAAADRLDQIQASADGAEAAL